MVTIEHPALPRDGRLICGPRPHRPFRESVGALVDLGVSTVACLLEDHEIPGELGAAYATSALSVLRFSIPDYGPPPDAPAFSVFLDDLLRRLHDRETVYLHCFAGLGRTGTALACLLRAAGAVGDPVRLARAVYDPQALESETQQRFARDFSPGRATRSG